MIFDLELPCTEHSWHIAPDGLKSCEWCGKIYRAQDDEPTGPKVAVLTCDCGSETTYGTKPFEIGHSSWCQVAPI